MIDFMIGLYVGALLIVVMYNMHWYVVTKDKSYLYYAIFKTLIATITFLMIKLPLDALHANALIALIFVFMILFTQEYLELKRDHPLIHKTLNAGIAFFIIGYLYIVYIDDHTFYNIAYSLVMAPLILISYFAYWRGNNTAKYLAISWTVGTSLVAIVDINALTEISFYPEFPFNIVGGILDSILISYAIHLKTQTLFKEKEELDKMLIHQSKLAASGQMLENISHQWNQPLNRISAFIISMQTHLFNNKPNPEHLQAILKDSQLQIEYMADTLHDFTNFHRRDIQKETFLASSVTVHINSIIGQTLIHKNISFDILVINDFPLHSYPNELSQVLLNLVQNAHDELLKRKTANPTIKIIIDKNNISVQDNAGGMDNKVASQIFDAYFTTKGDTSSLGLGLYMCNTILNKYFQTQLELEQNKDYTEFTIGFESLLQHNI